MNALTKLALFAVLLAMVFAVGAGLGAIVDSSGSSPPPTHAPAHAGQSR